MQIESDSRPEEVRASSLILELIRGRIPLTWRLAIAGMLLLSVGWFSYQSWRYFQPWKGTPNGKVATGGVDLFQRFRETDEWFRREIVYGRRRSAVYAPASYALFKIVFNGLSWTVVKPLWYLASLASVFWLSRCLIQESAAGTPAEKLFIGLLPFACYATGTALGNGQLVLFVLPLMLGAILRLNRPMVTGRDLGLGSLGMLFALVQPTLAAPFFWLFLWVLPCRKPAVLVVCGYLALTAIALAFQVGAQPPKTLSNSIKARASAANSGRPVSELVPTQPEAPPGVRRPAGGGWSLLEKWFKRARGGVQKGTEQGGYASLPNLLFAANLDHFNTPASLAVLLLLGAWIHRHRRGDLWLLLGVTAIVARFWTYHRWYDDLLLIVPMVTLFRITKQSQWGVRSRQIATILFLWMWIFLLAPGVLYTFPNPTPLVAIQVTAWIATLAFLAAVAERQRGGGLAPQTAPPLDQSQPLPHPI